MYYFVLVTTQVSQASRPDTTVCMCNHLTTFTVVIVPVNTIDFANAFSQDLSENALVFTFIVVVISIYLLVVIYMRRKDREDVLKVNGLLQTAVSIYL